MYKLVHGKFVGLENGLLSPWKSSLGLEFNVYHHIKCCLLSYYWLAVISDSCFLLLFQEVVPAFLENLTDEELKKEAKNEAKNDALSAIIKAIKCLVSRVPSQEETAKNLEIFRLKMILR